MKRWYAVYTKAKRETTVERLLSDAGLEVLNPKHLARKRGSSVQEPFFPCYIFAKFSLENDYRMVKYTRGVRKVVGGGDGPWPVPDEVINIIKSRMDDAGLVRIGPTDLKKGDRIEIRQGPFQGIVGILEREVPAKDRVVVLLESIATVWLEVDKYYVGKMLSK